jgi:hypothetical protein
MWISLGEVCVRCARSRAMARLLPLPRPRVTPAARFAPDDAATAVRCGDADVAFGIDYPDAPVPHAAGLDVLRIATESFGVGVAATKRLDPVLRLSDLAREQWILPPENSNCRRAIFTA